MRFINESRKDLAQYLVYSMYSKVLVTIKIIIIVTFGCILLKSTVLSGEPIEFFQNNWKIIPDTKASNFVFTGREENDVFHIPFL